MCYPKLPWPSLSICILNDFSFANWLQRPGQLRLAHVMDPADVAAILNAYIICFPQKNTMVSKLWMHWKAKLCSFREQNLKVGKVVAHTRMSHASTMWNLWVIITKNRRHNAALYDSGLQFHEKCWWFICKKHPEYRITTHFYQKISNQKQGLYIPWGRLKILGLKRVLRDVNVKNLR